ncbi:hypothetical protein PITC_094500 [Penicillium italicum]|uniref:Methyltransferase type 11 n=1 Tax=Penicillium italicum TaxID=40296 RepID=A0A0A2KL17_PENIT|nr:hypothetical protein PITC_094500 [Penicillium italicum]
MEHIAVDPDFYSLATAARTDPEDFQSETTSLASTIAKGRFENGRREADIKPLKIMIIGQLPYTYEAFRGVNMHRGPSDEQQFEAFEIGTKISHMVFLVLDHYEDNPLFRAPIGDLPKHILDIGTGQGSWAIDVADMYSSATVRGVDLFPPPVSWMPPNCVFEVDDVLQEWTWREPFDFIHIRLMYGAFPPEGWDQLYKQAYDALEPGGWIEQMEFDVRVRSDDDSLKEEHQLWSWGDMFIKCAKQAGRSLNTHETMRSGIEKAGFVSVHQKKSRIPLGPWPKNKVLKEVGQLQYAHWNAALEGWAMWLLTHFGEPEPWTKEEVQVFLAKVRVELKDPYIHGYNWINRVLQPVLKILAGIEPDDLKFAFTAARFVGLYRRLWESCVPKHIDSQKLEEENLVLREVGAHLRIEGDGLQLHHDNQLFRLRLFEQALELSRERLIGVLDN